MKPGKKGLHIKKFRYDIKKYIEREREGESDRYSVIEIYIYIHIIYRVSQLNNASSRDLYSV